MAPYCQSNSWKRKARQISDLGFDAEMQDALHQECLHPSDDQVDFVTGAPYLRTDRYAETRAETAQYEKELAELPLNATQTKILSYLRGLNYGHLFLRKLAPSSDALNEPRSSARMDPWWRLFDKPESASS